MARWAHSYGDVFRRIFSVLIPVILNQIIHREYCTAGADIIQTNTYGANATKLKVYGLEERVAEINQAGAKLAREFAGSDVYVGGSGKGMQAALLMETLRAGLLSEVSRQSDLYSMMLTHNSLLYASGTEGKFAGIGKR